jgi:hypothetical protein
MRVFITGGTGLVGSRLVPRLRQRGDTVVLLSRRPAAARDKFRDCEVVEGDPMKAGPWMDRLAECDGVVHLAGENVFGRRWNDEYKAMLRESRIQGTDNVVQALAKNPGGSGGVPKVLASASAIGFYGPHGDEEVTEESPAGNDFLARVCVDWENSARAAQSYGVRVALVRVGIVLDKEGGALAKLLTPFKLGVGGPVGTGKQWMAWIHHDDLVGLFLLALDNAGATGPVNGTAPVPVTNKDFSTALGKALGRPSFLPAPGFALRLVLGESADIVVTGQRVLPKRAQELGYSFRFPTIDAALQNVLK